MAQSLLIASPSTNIIRSPKPKRFRFSLKQEKSQPQEPADYAIPQKKSLVDISLKNQEDVLTDNCGVQDENVPPNCKVPEIKLSLFVSLEVVDRKNGISALGLPNCGNTCYLNSILQVLRYTPNFLNCVHLLSSQTWLNQVCPNAMKTKEAELFQKLHILYTTMKKQEDFLYRSLEKDLSSPLLDEIESFLLCLRELSSSFEEGEQHDAHELLLAILSSFTTLHDHVRADIAHALNHTSSTTEAQSETEPSNETVKLSQCKEKRKLKKKQKRNRLDDTSDATMCGNSQMSQNVLSANLGFEGKIRHIVQCLECEKKSEREEPFTNLEISIAEELINEGSIDLCQCLDHKIILSGENKYFCDDCYHLNEAQLSSEITFLPSILVIHCSWLKQSSIITRIEKDSTSLLIPMSLKTSQNTHIFHTSSDDTYCLYAVVLHLGTSAENGHYVSFIRDVPKTPALVNENQSGIEKCCASDGNLNGKLDPVNRWLLFDDLNVTPVCVSETSDTFPYYELLGIAASPCIIFYCKM